MTSTLTDAHRLDTLAHVLLASITADDPPAAVGVSSSGGDVALHLRELLGGDPAAELRGFRAPRDWWAFGVLAWVRVRSLDFGAVLSEHRPFIHLVSRSGESVNLIDTGDLCPVRIGGDDAHGRLSDACRRVLALPTPAPPADTRLLFALAWLDEVAATVQVAPGRRLSWSDVAALHPLTAMLQGDEILGPADDRLPALGRAFAQAWPWSRLWATCAGGSLPIAEIDPVTAAWADEGSFARMLLERYPELPDLLATLDALLAPSEMRRIRDTLAAWDLL
ncbi:MAG: hypothetical protein WHS89_07565 [Acidimicrobiales bacterium]